MTSSIKSRSASISSVAGCVVAARGLRLISCSASMSATDIPLRASASAQKSAGQPEMTRVAAGRGGDRQFRRELAERGDMADGVKYAERHDAAAGRRVGGDQQPVQRAVLLDQRRAQQRGAQIARRAE